MSLQGPGSQNEPGGLAALVAQIKTLQERLDELERGAILRTAGIVARPGYIAGTTYDGTDRTHLGTSGWMLGSDDDGPSYLVLNGRDPIVDLAAAIAGAVFIDGNSDYVTGFGIPGTNTVLASSSIAVPVGYTRATVLVTATMSYLGYVGSGDTYVRAQAGAGGSWGRASTAYLYDTSAITMSASSVVTVTGLSGGSITIQAAGYASAGAKPAVPSNTADVVGVAFFTR